MKISACVITKNEESNIAACLNSVQRIADEMVVVDTGSSDNTIAIARQCGAIVYSFEWKNDFAAAKNFAIEQAIGDWIIFLDADEFFSEESSIYVGQYLMQLEKQAVDAVMCQLINIDVDYNNRIKDSFATIRIFRNKPEIRYKNAIHEELIHKSRKLQVAMLTDELKIYHTGYSTNIVERKLQRNLEIILAEIEKNGDEKKYYRYLCDCYHGLKEYEKAVKYAKLHIATSETSINSESIVYLKMLYALMQTTASTHTIKQEFENAISIFKDIPDFYAQYANYLFDQKLYAQAILYYQQAIAVYKMRPNTDIATAFTGNLAAVYCNLGRLFLLKNEPETAMHYFFEVLMINKYDAYAFEKFYQIIAKYPEVQIIELLNSIYQRNQKNITFLVNQLNINILSKVYVYYTNILKNEFGVEDENILPYQLLSLKNYEALYQYSLNNFIKN